MRKLTRTLADVELELLATFAAGVELADQVADPLYIAREAGLEAMMSQRGLPYTPKWMFTIQNIPVILYIGLKAAGSKMQMKEVQELVFSAGLPAARDIAIEYIGLLVGPAPEEELDEMVDAEDKTEGN